MKIVYKCYNVLCTHRTIRAIRTVAGSRISNSAVTLLYQLTDTGVGAVVCSTHWFLHAHIRSSTYQLCSVN